MRVASLQLGEFRNYHRAAIALSPGLNLMAGANGQGKSNLLEALCMLSVGRSFRSATDSDMVNWGADHAVVACTLLDGPGGESDAPAESIEMEIRAGARKQIRVDGAPLETLSDLVGMVRTVHLSPEVIDEQFRSPSGRRRMLDVLISQADRAYLAGLKRHRQIVLNLNALYKHPAPDALEMDAWERQLAEAAVPLATKRRRILEELEPVMAERFRVLFGGCELSIRIYATLPEGDDPEATANAATGALRESREQARRRGYVTRGVHRDRLDVELDGRAIESHASQGQVKGAYFAWKLAEGDVLAKLTGQNPLWLVDDPFSEMDRERALSLLETFTNAGQVVITTARDADLPLEEPNIARWQVNDGTIERER